MAGKTLIRGAKAIVSCDAADTVYKDADILIEGQMITAIGKDLGKDGTFDEVIPGEGCFVYPGLVNTHHHFFQEFVRNLVTIDYPNMTVPEWISKIYRIFQEIDDDVIYYTSLTAMSDLLKHGCTTAFDHQYCYTVKSGKRPVDRQMEAAKLLGIRYHAGRGANTLPPSAGSEIPEKMVETTDEFLQDCERLVSLYHDPAPFSMSQIVPAPCQPMNCYPETFRDTVSFCRERGLRMHTHMGEGECEVMKERFGMRTPYWAEKIGFLGDDVWVAHAWELTDDEYELLGRTGTGVSYCPTPAIMGGFPILPMQQMQRAGVNISIGCDGSATNDGSNLLDAMRLAWMAQCWYTKKRGGSISPYEMLKIATINGAKTLGRNDLGSLEAGKAADLFMIDTRKMELTGALHDPMNLIVRTGLTGCVDLTMVGGKVVWNGRELSGINEQELAAEGERVFSRVLRDPFKTIYPI